VRAGREKLDTIIAGWLRSPSMHTLILVTLGSEPGCVTLPSRAQPALRPNGLSRKNCSSSIIAIHFI